MQSQCTEYVGNTPLTGILHTGHCLFNCMCLPMQVIQKSVCMQGKSMTFS